MTTKEPCGSIATRQALRMLGVSAAEMPHILQVSFRRLLRDCRFLLLSKILQSGEKQRGCELGGQPATRPEWDSRQSEARLPLSSPWPILPSRPMTTLHGRDVTCTKPRHQSHSFCKPTRLMLPFFLRALQKKNQTTESSLLSLTLPALAWGCLTPSCTCWGRRC